MKKKSAVTVDSADRALALIQALGEEGSLSVTDAAKGLGVAVSTAHRLLATLVNRRFAMRGPNRLYYPGPEMSWRPQGPPGAHLMRTLRPFLERINAETQETVHLIVPIGSDVIITDGIESSMQLRVGLRIGLRMPACCGAGGRAMLADLEWKEVKAMYSHGLPPWATSKIHDWPALKQELQTTRHKGYGLNLDETEQGIAVMGISIRDLSRRPLAAISITFPSHRYAIDREEAFAKCLMAIKPDCEHATALSVEST